MTLNSHTDESAAQGAQNLLSEGGGRWVGGY